jgi:hypothetical protein
MTMGTLFLTLGVAGAFLAARGRTALPREHLALVEPSGSERAAPAHMTIPIPRTAEPMPGPLNGADRAT